MTTTRRKRGNKSVPIAVAVFDTSTVKGTVICKPAGIYAVKLFVTFTALPPGKHGFHIHESGDLRGEGCKGACAHYHRGKPSNHGDEPGTRRERHTGDLGNVELPSTGPFEKTYVLKGVKIQDLWGRSCIVHADEDDLGLGEYEDSQTTGHSGARLACAIFGRSKGTCT